jgi:hypothetical protein
MWLPKNHNNHNLSSRDLLYIYIQPYDINTWTIVWYYFRLEGFGESRNDTLSIHECLAPCVIYCCRYKAHTSETKGFGNCKMREHWIWFECIEMIHLVCDRHCRPVFKIKVFNALQTRFGPSKYPSLKHNPSNRNPKLTMKTTSLEVLYNIIYPSQDLTSVGHCHYTKWSWTIDSWFFTLYWKHVPYHSRTSFIWVS